MSFLVLQSEDEIDRARTQLLALGIPRLEPRWLARLKANGRRLRLPLAPTVGDHVKSWDVLATVNFIEDNLGKNASIADFGAYGSEILLALDCRGYSSLTGIDLNPQVLAMPRADRIDYIVSDYRSSGLPEESFDAITSISVMEHGYMPTPTFAAVARLLRPGGYFIASFDYWPEKISVGDLKLFGMSWTIFSEQDVAAMLVEASKHGLEPVGATQPTAQKRAISHSGFDYTFGWMALQKRP